MAEIGTTNEAMAEPKSNAVSSVQSAPYTVWSTRSRRLLVALLGYLALSSALTVTIYFPLIEVLAARYGVSTQAINLTITLYIVVQGIVPSLWSPLSDSWGRRPVYLASFTIFTVASLALTIVDRNYPALLIFRAMQSIGSSAIISLSYATVSDIVVHSERGSYLAPMLGLTNFGPCIAPVIGGGIVFAAEDPRWCFRALLIFGASATLLIGWTMPETARSIVGNGARPAQGLWLTWWKLLSRALPSISFLPSAFKSRPSDAGFSIRPSPAEIVAELEHEENFGKTGKGRFILPNPFPSMRLVFYPDTFLVLWLSGCPSSVLFCVQTSTSPIFTNNYGFNPLNVGLCYTAGGFGIFAAAFISGRLMDWNYRHVATTAGFSIDRRRGDDMRDFVRKALLAPSTNQVGLYKRSSVVKLALL
jgi:MFS family permease